MTRLNNREEVIEQLTEILMGFAKSCNKYQTDVYLYYSPKTGTAELDTFVNVGGNSWLNDDHYTIYRDKEHFEDWTDYYTETGDFAWGLDMEWSDFKEEVIEFLDLDDDEKEDYKIDYHDALSYIKSRDDYTEKLIEVYEDYIEETRSEYAEQAEEIISDWEEDYDD